MNWISVKDALPPEGEWVLICHYYRVTEYGTQYALAQRIRSGKKKVEWVWVAGKAFTDDPKRMNPMEQMYAHTLRPGNRYVTHWMPLPDGPQPIDRAKENL